jgi:hypothetical protein
MDWTTLGESAVREGVKLMSSPRVAKVIQDPRVAKMVSNAIELGGTVQAAVGQRVKGLARRFDLVTRDEVRELEARQRELEEELHEVRAAQAARESKPKRA